MTSPPTRLYTAEQVRRLDRFCIDQCQIPGIDLMRRAGRVAFDLVREAWPGARCLHVVCGGGNNGGDGYVVAELGLAAGLEVIVWAARQPDLLKADARTAAFSYLEAGGEVREADGIQLRNADVVIDALLGTGLADDVSAGYGRLIEHIVQAGKPVLAIDIPAGISADSGQIMGRAVKASITPTFIGRKRGLYTADGIEYAGRVHFDDLEVPAQAYEAVGSSAILESCSPSDYPLPPRPLNSHKGMFGHLVVIGGDVGMPGAVRLAGEAALRCGAGLVTVATHPEHAELLTVRTPELMSFAVHNFAELATLVERATIVAIGPGLGRTEWSEQCFATAVNGKRPLVVDADGLFWLSQWASPVPQSVLTPHPGEAALLLRTSTGEVQADRFGSARAIADRYEATVALKGAGTIISSPDAETGVCSFANPAMATAGMGDVLTGTIGALRAQGLAPQRAALAGVVLHAGAANAAAPGCQRGMLASDLLPHLMTLVNS